MKSFYQYLTMLSLAMLALFVLFEGGKKDISTGNNADVDFLILPPTFKETDAKKDDAEEVVFRCRKEVKMEMAPEPTQQLNPSKSNE